jgi:tRNA threonylcarbamoyladenosine biosynthesis protein TsaB
VTATPSSAPLLALDAGSPRVSVAVGDGDSIRAEACERHERSSATLLGLVDEVLDRAGLAAGDLGGLIALRGPGSFTGLRVALSTVLGLHQALALPAVAVPTLEILAAAGPGDGSTVVAVVDALRGEWFAQPFRSTDPPRALDEPRLLSAAAVQRHAPATVVGFGAERLAGAAGADLRTLEPPPLAAVAVGQIGRFPVAWDPASLVAPLYLRPPSAQPARQP